MENWEFIAEAETDDMLLNLFFESDEIEDEIISNIQKEAKEMRDNGCNEQKS